MNYSPDEPTYRCRVCYDKGFVSRPFKSCSTAWFCGCDAGSPRESGYWFEKRYPAGPTGRRLSSESGKRQLDEYLFANPEQRAWLPDALEALRIRYEDARKRKLEGDTE
jgi:hypothetical protein